MYGADALFLTLDQSVFSIRIMNTVRMFYLQTFVEPFLRQIVEQQSAFVLQAEPVGRQAASVVVVVLVDVVVVVVLATVVVVGPPVVVVVVAGGLVVVVLDEVVVVVVVVVGRVVVVVLVVVGGVAGKKVASTMFQLVLEPRVRLPCCGPAALDRMSSRSEAALPFCTSRRYGTVWLLPAVAQPGWPPVSTAATTSSPAGAVAIGPNLAEAPAPCDVMAWSSAPTCR